MVNEDVRVRCCETLARSSLACLPWLSSQGVAEEELKGLLGKVLYRKAVALHALKNAGD